MIAVRESQWVAVALRATRANESVLLVRRRAERDGYPLRFGNSGSPRWPSAGTSKASISPFRPAEMRFAHPCWASTGYH
jgi:hypothetical protein